MTELERLITKGEVQINPHPITGITRLAVLENGFHWYPLKEQIIMQYTVYYLDANGERYTLESLKGYLKNMIADGVTFVNQQGNVIVPEPEDNTVYKTEYQFFVDIANAQINIFQLMLDTTLLRASQGKFDI
jgi:hypothetical protein